MTKITVVLLSEMGTVEESENFEHVKLTERELFQEVKLSLLVSGRDVPK